jgi:hypothetical protein
VITASNLGTPVFGKCLPSFYADPLKLCQVGCGVSLHSYFQVSPEIFDRVQVWALAGPFKDIQRLDCVVRVVVLLEGEPYGGKLQDYVIILLLHQMVVFMQQNRVLTIVCVFY